MATVFRSLFGVGYEVESCTSQLAKEAIKARTGVCQRMVKGLASLCPQASWLVNRAQPPGRFQQRVVSAEASLIGPSTSWPPSQWLTDNQARPEALYDGIE